VEGEGRGEIVTKPRLAHLSGRSVKVVDRWMSEGMPVHTPASGRGADILFATGDVVLLR
jgi:phage terminase Nu1 subunit (DNA packaging protein)